MDGLALETQQTRLADADPPRSPRRYAVPAIIGFAPALAILLTWAMSVPVETIALIKHFALPVVAAELLVIAIALRAGLRGAVTRPAPLVLAAAAALLVIALGTALWAAPSPALAAIRNALWLIHLLFGFAVWHLRRRGWFGAADLTDALMAGFVVSALLLGLFVLQLGDPARFDWMNGLPGFDNVRRVAYYAAPVIGLCIGRFASRPDRRGWAPAFAVAILAFTLIFWNGARGALFALAAALIVGLFLFPALRHARIWAATAGSALLGALAALALPGSGAFMGVRRMFLTNFSADAAVPSSGVTSGRAELWSGTLEAIGRHPWFGYGEGQVWYVVPAAKTFQVAHPHNVLLQVLLAWGVIGALCVAILAVPFALKVTRNVRARSGEWLPPMIAMLVLAAYSMVDGTLFHVLATSLFAACAGLVAVGAANGRMVTPARFEHAAS